jgi:hypothetical protein
MQVLGTVDRAEDDVARTHVGRIDGSYSAQLCSLARAEGGGR